MFWIKLAILISLIPNVLMLLPRVKLNFAKGIVCNMESFQSVTHRVINRYFCVPSGQCRPSPHRIPVIPKDLCDDYYSPVKGDKVICCHQADFKERPDNDWLSSFLFLPSFRSYVMCRHYSHLLCGADGSNTCNPNLNEKTDLLDSQGIPQIVEKFPHTALIGYATNKENTTFKWLCMGSVVSERAVITASKCEYEVQPGETVPTFSTHVKVGESIICDHCKDREGEQVIGIKRWESNPTQKNNIDIIVLQTDIQWNKKVRPACIMPQPAQPTTGWYVHYGKPDKSIITGSTDFPTFVFPLNPNFITFKVKGKENVQIYLMDKATPNSRENYWKINLAVNEDRFSSTMELSQPKPETNGSRSINSNIVYKIRKSDMINDREFRGFWIRINNNSITFGKEDEDEPLLAYYKNATTEGHFPVNVVGFRTPTSTAEWIIADHEGLFSLHGSEVDVLWGEKCSQYHTNFRTVDKYFEETGDRFFKGEDQFCSGNQHTGLSACQNDWGSTVQFMNNKELPCMWQIIGLYNEEESRNCSAVNSPALFKNFANYLMYIEDNVYPWFSRDWFKLKTDRPRCMVPSLNLSDPGRCPFYTEDHR